MRKLNYKYREPKKNACRAIILAMENWQIFDIPAKFVLDIGRSKNSVRRLVISKKYLDEITEHYWQMEETDKKEEVQERFANALDIGRIYFSEADNYGVGSEMFNVQYMISDEYPDGRNVLQSVEDKEDKLVFAWERSKDTKRRKKGISTGECGCGCGGHDHHEHSHEEEEHHHHHEDGHKCCGGHGEDGHKCCGGHGHHEDGHECCGGHGHHEEN